MRREEMRLKKASYRARYPEQSAKHIRAAMERRRLNVAAALFGRAKARALAKGVPFTITVADIVVPAMCPALGLPMVLGGDRENSPTLDRVIPALGYVPGNVRVISYRANRIKTDATIEELRGITAYLAGALEA